MPRRIPTQSSHHGVRANLRWRDAVAAVKSSAEDPVSGVKIIEIADPVPAPDQVVVNVRACSLNHHDLWTLREWAYRSTAKLARCHHLGDASGLISSQMRARSSVFLILVPDIGQSSTKRT
jgi:hypothetical protein